MMKFCLHFGNIAYPDPADAKRLVLAAEAAGFESVIAVEHVVIPTDYTTRYPYAESGRLPGGIDMPWPDPLAWLTYVGALTSRLKLITGVLVLPQRNPLVLAKHLATIDHMTGGRLELGIGVGWLREEFEALGVPFERRGARTNEYIGAMRALWDGDDASFDGEFVSFNGMSCNPKPANGRVPIVVGGNSKPAIRRAAQLGDGYFPATGDASLDVGEIIQAMRAEARNAGRDPAAIEVMAGCPDALPASGKDPLTAIADRAAAGVGRVILPLSAFEADLEGMLGEFGEKVIAPLNG
ncbi:MAG: LLM class F420-dependent oxidoreductase [Alphaproteobacteria bacterium]